MPLPFVAFWYVDAIDKEAIIEKGETRSPFGKGAKLPAVLLKI
jgi:hypothetical protein